MYWFKRALIWYVHDKNVQNIARPEDYINKNWERQKSNIEVIREPILNLAYYYYTCLC
jgi:hypothetical protein